jgi:hypothetical protein
MAFGSKAKTPSISSDQLFVPAVDLEVVKGLKLGYFGNPKAGKTHLALTAPKPIYYIDIDITAKGILKKGVDNKFFETEEDINIFNVSKLNPKTNKVDYDYTLNVLEEAVANLCDRAKDNPHGTIVIDPVSELFTMCNIWLDEQENISRTKDGTKPLRTEWSKRDRKYFSITEPLKHCGLNIIFIGSTASVYNGGVETPDKQAKWHSSVPSWVDICGKLEYNGKIRKLTITEDRFSLSNERVIENPTWDKIVSHLADNVGITIA